MDLESNICIYVSVIIRKNKFENKFFSLQLISARLLYYVKFISVKLNIFSEINFNGIIINISSLIKSFKDSQQSNTSAEASFAALHLSKVPQHVCE
jgi:hypothetical protein